MCIRDRSGIKQTSALVSPPHGHTTGYSTVQYVPCRSSSPGEAQEDRHRIWLRSDADACHPDEMADVLHDVVIPQIHCNGHRIDVEANGPMLCQEIPSFMLEWGSTEVDTKADIGGSTSLVAVKEGGLGVQLAFAAGPLSECGTGTALSLIHI